MHAALVESLEELRRYIWFAPWVVQDQTLDNAKKRCAAARLHFENQSDIAYLVFDKDAHCLIGSVGFHRTNHAEKQAEIGYWLRTSCTGNGYASDAVLTLCQWAKQHLNSYTLKLIIDETNKPSRALAARCGFLFSAKVPETLKTPDGKPRINCIYVK